MIFNGENLDIFD